MAKDTPPTPEQEPVFKEPDILKRIASVRQSLDATAPEDHIAQVDEWERRAKKALIFLNLQGHEGIQELIKRARNEIADINAILLKDRDAGMRMSPEVLMAESLERQRLYDQRALWGWFLGLFEEAKFDITQIVADLDIEQQGEIVETP